MAARRPVAFGLICTLFLLTLLVPANTFAASPPALSLPIPAGQTWKIIQGYNCGTHAGYDKNAIDIVNANGPTRGTPVLAAADGTLWWKGGQNGVVILSHGAGWYTMYSHLESLARFSKGDFVARGTVIGTNGAAGTSYNNPHLHFEIFHGDGPSAANRYTIPLSFVEGYSLSNNGRCNQHAGTLLTATGSITPMAATRDTTPPSLPTLIDPGQGLHQIVTWSAATDDSGVKGYQLYVGQDPAGTGEWFVAETQVALPALAPGRNYVRIRTLDNAGNASAWTTLLEVDG